VNLILEMTSDSRNDSCRMDNTTVRRELVPIFAVEGSEEDGEPESAPKEAAITLSSDSEGGKDSNIESDSVSKARK
jgi:hypothetical protein